MNRSALIAGSVTTCWLNARHYEWSDDAFIDARQFTVSSKAADFISDVKAKTTSA